MGRDFHRTRKFGLVVKFYAKAPINIQKLIKIILIEIFKKSVFFLFESQFGFSLRPEFKPSVLDNGRASVGR